MLAGVALAAFGGAPAWAQTAPQADPDVPQDETGPVEIGDVVVTGSRIRRSDTTTSAPVGVITQQALTDRGFTQVGQALNDLTAITPSVPQSEGSGGSSGGGQQYASLFGLGSGRTLTLLNGRRMVSTASGMSDSLVDTNMVPTGLLKQIEVVQGGGAAVYGSDAIAGVINYILRDDFDGLELDGQTGISSRGDYPTHSLRITGGRNFAGDRGNVALNLEWSRTDSLFFPDRPAGARGRVTGANPLNTGPDDGIPSVTPIFDAAFWSFNDNGVVFRIPAPFPAQFATAGNVPYPAGGTPLQFNSAGELVPFDPGQINGIPFASGGDGFRFNELGALYSGVERKNANLIGHYDLTDNVRLSTELLYGKTVGTDPLGSSASNTVLNAASTGSNAIQFNRNNPFLSTTAIDSLIAASPSFAFGAPLFLSKSFPDLLTSEESLTTTEVYRALVALDGDVTLGDRELYWSVSASYGRAEGEQSSLGVWQSRFANAINATRNGAGEIVCAINNDANPNNDDASCAPINPFGAGNVSDAARAYVTTEFGQNYVNEQTSFLATLGGSLFTLPAGDARFSVAYERRGEEAVFTPKEASALGLGRPGTPVVGQSGEYHTNEYSAEVLIPIVGGDFRLPFVEALELTGAYRQVDNSIAGKENVWNIGGRWDVTEDLTLRASRSRNFRAPNLSQLFEPTSVELDSVGRDPCDVDRIDSGPNPAVRRANCVAEWAANGYGDLSTFQSLAENTFIVPTTVGGNPDLRNEVSNTTTWGVIWQPAFVPGLTVVADRIEVELTDGLSLFGNEQFLATCYDSTEPSDEICSRFERDATGQIIRGTAQTFNAGSIRFEGETYNVNYTFPVGDFFPHIEDDLGRLELNLEATHTALLETSVTGFDRLRSDGTTEQPDWSARFDARYDRGPLRLGYSLNYLPQVLRIPNTTIESDPNPVVNANYRHSISAQYDLTQKVTVRAGIDNLTDEGPSFPTLSYGDIIGRYFYAGVRARF
jgi:outer membrane receptor protein involved in Fe transport